MNHTGIVRLEVRIVEEEVYFSLAELCQACGAREEQVRSLISEGVLEPSGRSQDEWRFGGDSLRRARLALHLAADLEINTPGVALALDLIDEIAGLKARMRRSGLH